MEMISPYSFPGLKMAGLSKERYPYLNYKKTLMTKEEIIEVICKEGNVTLEELSSGSRKSEIVNSRKLLSGVLKIKLNMTLVSIGQILGGRDHTTIRHQLLKFKDHCQYDDVFRLRARLILNKLGTDFHDNYIDIKDNR
jgi:chromosomal replication initiation ATPase DnaA